jgi:hypothetical protein
MEPTLLAAEEFEQGRSPGGSLRSARRSENAPAHCACRILRVYREAASFFCMTDAIAT